MKPWQKCLLLLSALFVYLSAGAFVMVSIEKEPVIRFQMEFIGNLTAFIQTHYACGVSTDRVLAFMEKAGEAYPKGAFHSALASPDAELVAVWSWPNAILFASSVVATIGYGRLAPRTFRGQLFCTFFAILGIPLCYVMFSVVGDTFNELWKKFIRGSDWCFKAIKTKKLRRLLLGALTLTGLWMLLALLPSGIFTRTEPWDWWRAQYFCFVSLSTIGFGDLIYGLEREGDSYLLDWCYKMGILVYLFLGLSLISIVFKGVWHSQRKNLFRTHARIRRSHAQRNRSYTLRSSPPSGVRRSLRSDSSVVSLTRSIEQGTSYVVEHLHDIIDFGALEIFKRHEEGHGVIGISYRLNDETVARERDSGHGSAKNSHSESETTI